jgi:O-antigen ligase
MRPSPRLPLWVLPPAIAAAGAVIFLFATQGQRPDVDVFERVIAGLAGVAGVAVAMSVRPAWPLSLGLAFTAFSGHWGDMNSPLPLDRVLLFTGIASVLVRERLRSPTALRLRPIDLLLGLLAVYALTSALLVGALKDESARFALLDRYSLLGFTLFFVAPMAFREERDRQILLKVLVGLGLYLGLTALFETTGPDALVMPDYIKDPFIGTHQDRARGPFTEASANGAAMFACGVAATLALLHWRGRRARILAGLVIVLCGLGILFTVTRGAWLSSGMGAILALLAAREARPFLFPAIAAAALGVVLAFALVPGLQHKASSRASSEAPIWDRRNSNSAALRMVHDRPLVGFGWGTYQYYSFPYYRQSQDFPLTFVRGLHNVYLANAVELGLAGAALWLFGLVVALGGSIARRGPPELRVWKLALIALCASVLVSMASTPFAFAMPTLLLWTWAGIARGESEHRVDHALGSPTVVQRAEPRHEPLVGAGVAS